MDENQSRQYLVKAYDVLINAEKINKDEVYNLACLYALMGEFEHCRTKLLVCKEAGTLPNKAHLMADDDLNSAKGLDWFQDLIEGLA